MEDKIVISSLEAIKALSDPYRMQIINCFRKFNIPLTVKEIADELDEVPAKVHYHVKKLEKAEIIKLVSTKNINGIIAKYYEPVARQFVIEHKDVGEPVSKLLEKETEKLVNQIFSENLNLFLDMMRVEDKEDIMGNIMSRRLYLSKEEAREFLQYVSDFCSKHNSPVENKETDEYLLFTTFIPDAKANPRNK